MVPLGWNDQNGEFIPYTLGEYPYYHLESDTTYTALWGYKVILDANEGIFPQLNLMSVAAVIGIYTKKKLQMEKKIILVYFLFLQYSSKS